MFSVHSSLHHPLSLFCQALLYFKVARSPSTLRLGHSLCTSDFASIAFRNDSYLYIVDDSFLRLAGSALPKTCAQDLITFASNFMINLL